MEPIKLNDCVAAAAENLAVNECAAEQSATISNQVVDTAADEPGNHVALLSGLEAHAFATYEGMQQNLSTGEAIVNGIQTGWYFERAVQVLPTPWDPETGRHIQYVSPWAFATLATAKRIRDLMQAHTSMKLEIFDGDQNLHFPTSVLQRHIGVKDAPRRVAVNAGLVASYIARTTARLGDGMGGTRVVQSDRLAIAGAIESLARALE